MPQAPLSLPPTVRSVRPVSIVPEPSGALPARRMPPQESAEEPPRGRVMILEDDAVAALSLQRLLLEAGYRPVGPACEANEAERLLDRTPTHWPITCALLNVGIAGADRIAERLVARGAPVVWTVPRGFTAFHPNAAPDAPTLDLPSGRDALLDAMTTAVRRLARPRVYVTPPPQAAWPRVFPQL
jgi:hypothetical protein